MLTAVVVAGTVACAADPVETAPERDGRPGGGVDAAPWVVIEPTFDGHARSISSMAEVDGTYVAAGIGVDGRGLEELRIWRADPLPTFDEVWSAGVDRSARDVDLVEVDGTLLLGASGQQRTDTEWEWRSWLWLSEDGGLTWTELDRVAFATTGASVCCLTRTDAGVLAQVWDDDGHRSWFSEDLRSWEPAPLPGARPDDRIVLASDDVHTWAATTRWDDRRERQVVLAWRSDDGGRSFVPDAELPAPSPRSAFSASETAIAVDGALLVWPSYGTGYDYVDPDGVLETGPWRLADGRWSLLESDEGQWGDAGTGARPDGVAQLDGRTLALIGRTRRANPHHCFADPATCEQSESAVVTTIDGVHWTDLAGADLSGMWPEGLLTGDDGSIAVWGRRTDPDPDRGPALQIVRWPGPGLPMAVDPPSIDPPDRPVPLYQGGPLPVGEPRRYILQTDSCGRGHPYLWIDDREWEPTEPIPSPLPVEWPSRVPQWVPEPEPWLYVRLERVDTDEIVVSVEDIGRITTLVPETEEHDVACI